MSRPTLFTLLLLHSVISSLTAQAPHGATPASQALECSATGEGVASALLARSIAAVGIPEGTGQALRIRGERSTLQIIQSDRTYPPFFSSFSQVDGWYDPASGAERIETQRGAFPGSEFPRSAFLTSRKAIWFLRDTAVIAAPDFSAGATVRPLNPWAVLQDFRGSSDVMVTGRCQYRDYSRIALTRTGPYGSERLLLDAKTFVPMALLRVEPHFLWGQAQVEYVWSNWDQVAAGGLFPLTSFRVVDGETELSTTVTDAAMLPVDSAPRLVIPDTTLALPAASTAFYQPSVPDTIRVGANAWLLRNPFYTVGAVLARDTVFVLDATLGEARARQDSTWIGRLFPGRHPVVLVVTDLAWPHIAGVRFWVASGAIVVSHRASRTFLERVVNHRWTREPDVLEKRRASVRFIFRGVDDSLALAGGDLVLHAIDGASSEAALMAWLPGEHFLWASDYIQNLRQPTEYAREVLRATRRVGIDPERFAAEHVRLSPWKLIDSLHADETAVTPPPSRSLNAQRLKLGTLTRHGRITSPGAAPRDMGARTQKLSVVVLRGQPTLVSVQTFSTPRGVIVDSSLNDLATLAPIRHSSTGAGRTMMLDFAGAAVRGRYIPDGKAPVAINQHFSAAPYDSNIFDLVIAALPLSEGYVTSIPLYVYEQGGLLWWKATVSGTENVGTANGGTVEAWTVDIEEAGRRRARLWITKSSPEVVQSTYYISPGVEYTSTSR